MSRFRRKRIAEINSNKFIKFEDDNVKLLCITNFDTSGNERLSKKEAKAVKFAWNWSDNTDIKTFNELKYFTGLTFSPIFTRDSNLISIMLPDTVTNINDQSFDYCTSLATVTLPKSLERIKSYAFRQCTNLDIESLPEGIIIETSAFNNCTNLTLKNLPNGTIIQGSANFCNCINIEFTKLPSTITNIPWRCFYNCAKINFSLEGVTNIEQEALYNCTGLEITELPDSLEYLHYLSLYNCSFPNALTKFPSNIKRLGGANFRKVTFKTEGTYIKDYFVKTPSTFTDMSFGVNYMTTFGSSKGYIYLTNIENILLYNIPAGSTDGYILPNTINTITSITNEVDFGRCSGDCLRILWQDGGTNIFNIKCVEHTLLAYVLGSSCIIRDFPSNVIFIGSSETLSLNTSSSVKYTIFRGLTAPTLSTTLTWDWPGKIFIYEGTDAAYETFFSMACGNVDDVKAYIGSSDWVTAMQALAKEEGYYDEENKCWLDVFANVDYDWTDEYVDYDIYGIDRPESTLKTTYLPLDTFDPYVTAALLADDGAASSDTDNLYRTSDHTPIDLDGDGKISVAEANKVINMSGFFEDNREITDLSCLKYFPNVTAIPGSTKDGTWIGEKSACDNLTTIYSKYIKTTGGRYKSFAKLSRLILPRFTSKEDDYLHIYSLENCEVVDLGINAVALMCMDDLMKGKYLVLRKTSEILLYGKSNNSFITSYPSTGVCMFVPNSLLTTYKESEYYTAIADHIYSIGGAKWQEVFAENATSRGILASSPYANLTDEEQSWYDEFFPTLYNNWTAPDAD